MPKGLGGDFLWRSAQVWAKEGAVFALLLLAVFLLSPEDFGLYSYVGGFAFLFVILGDFGVSATVAKLASERRDDPEGLGAAFWNGLFATLGFTALALALAWLSVEIFLVEHAHLFAYALPAIALSPLASFFDGYHRGLREFKALSVVSGIAAAAFLAASAYLVPTYGLPGALFAQSVFFAAFILAALPLRRRVPFRPSRAAIHTILRYSLVVGLGTIGYFVYAKVGGIVLGKAGYIVEAGQYELATRLLAVAVLAFSVFGQVLGPRLVALKDDGVALRERIGAYRRGSVGAALAASVLLAVAVPLAVYLFLPAYWNASFLWTFALLALALPFDLWAVIQRQGILVPLGYAGAMTMGTVYGGIALLALSVLFIALMGPLGVALAALLARAGTTLWQDRFLARKLRAD